MGESKSWRDGIGLDGRGQIEIQKSEHRQSHPNQNFGENRIRQS